MFLSSTLTLRTLWSFLAFWKGAICRVVVLGLFRPAQYYRTRARLLPSQNFETPYLLRGSSVITNCWAAHAQEIGGSANLRGWRGRARKPDKKKKLWHISSDVPDDLRKQYTREISISDSTTDSNSSVKQQEVHYLCRAWSEREKSLSVKMWAEYYVSHIERGDTWDVHIHSYVCLLVSIHISKKDRFWGFNHLHARCLAAPYHHQFLVD